MEKKEIKFFYDLETTGLDVRKHSIHHIAGILEIDNEVVETINLKTRPNPKAKIEKAALDVAGVTEEEILQYPPMEECFLKLRKQITQYVDPYDKTEKAFLIGYNNRYFDDRFFSAWFEQNGDKFMGALFWYGLDVMSLATEYLLERRPKMFSFKLGTVARELGIKVDVNKLHDALYDVTLSREIYKIVTSRDLL